MIIYFIFIPTPFYVYIVPLCLNVPMVDITPLGCITTKQKTNMSNNNTNYTTIKIQR